MMLPAAVDLAHHALYECPRCGNVAPWTEGVEPDDDRNPLMFCACGAEFDPRPHQVAEGAADGETPPPPDVDAADLPVVTAAERDERDRKAFFDALMRDQWAVDRSDLMDQYYDSMTGRL